MLSAALIATRRCEPLSRPFVYQEFSARSLLMTHRSRPRAGCTSRAALARRDVPEAFAPHRRARQRAGRCSRAGTGRAPQRSLHAAVGPRRRSRACWKIHGLRSAPRPTSTPATRPAAQPIDELRRLHAVAAAEDGNAQPDATRSMRSQSDEPE